MKKIVGILLLGLGLLTAPHLSHAQCPMCKAAVTTGSNYGEKDNQLVAGLNAGILYLFLLPYGSLILLGIVAVVAYRRYQRSAARQISATTVEDIIGNHRPLAKPPS
jgi:hypothetical protein